MNLTFNIGSIAINTGVNNSFNSMGLGATLEFFRTPLELTLSVQTLFPWTLYLEISKK
jgi:hypothetical protein